MGPFAGVVATNYCYKQDLFGLSMTWQAGSQHRRLARAGWEIGTVDPLQQAVIWSVIPIALFMLATAVSVYAFRHRQPRGHEDPVERAYLEARADISSASSERRADAPSALTSSSR